MRKILKKHSNIRHYAWRLAILLVFVSPLLNSAYSTILLANNISFPALLLSIFDSASLTQFGLFYLLLFFAGDVCIKYKNRELTLSRSILEKKPLPFHLLATNFIYVCIFVGTLIIVLLVMYFIKMDGINPVILERNYIDAPIGMAVNSILLNIVNYTFLLSLALLINLITKQWFGTLSIFFFCWLQYDLRLFSSTIGRTLILPIEHTLIYYDSISLYAERPPISTSYVYWVIVFFLLYGCFHTVITRLKNKRESDL